jgi:hypothetical protein
MHRLRNLIVGAAALFCAAMIAWNAWTAYGPPVWIPRIACPEPELHFGERPASGSFEHSFTLVNAGGAPLTVEDIRTNCGCVSIVTPQPVQLPLLVVPGEEFRICALVDLAAQAGAVRHHIAVHSDDPRNPAFRLEIRGTVVRTQ